MKRYLSKERVLTPQEQLDAYRARVIEAEDALAEAVEELHNAVHGSLPTTATEYVEVKPGEPGYEDAPFENSLIMDMREEASKYMTSSPWNDLVERGTYPNGLGSGM